MLTVSLVLSIAAIVVSLVAALASVGLWFAARRANGHAASALAIESERHHREQLPVFEITAQEEGIGSARAYLIVKLVWPDLLDLVTVSILDEAGQDHWGSDLPRGVGQEEADGFVWGPWEFAPAASDQVENNRTAKPRAYSLASGKNWDRLGLARTRPGFWMGGMAQDIWTRDHAGPLRLALKCRRDEQSWLVQSDIDVQAL